jgi:hypothetical protein
MSGLKLFVITEFDCIMKLTRNGMKGSFVNQIICKTYPSVESLSSFELETSDNKFYHIILP